jgi:hypothetical protein
MRSWISHPDTFYPFLLRRIAIPIPQQWITIPITSIAYAFFDRTGIFFALSFAKENHEPHEEENRTATAIAILAPMVSVILNGEGER